MLSAEAHGARGQTLIAVRGLILAAALALVAAGCGDDDEDSDGRYASSSGEDPYLDVTLDPDGEDAKRPMTEAATCADGGTACEELRDLAPNDFEPVSPGVACTDIYGGADMVSVEGNVGGEAVSATFTRANGCEIDRFERIAPLLKELFPDYKPGTSLGP